MIACLRLPHFAASLEERAHPEIRGKPFALADERQTVTGMSRPAARAGVRAGMTLSQARAHCDELKVRPAIRSYYQRAFGDLLAALTKFTEQVEPEQGLELRADARQWRTVTFLHPAQLDDYPAATCYLDLGRLKSDETQAFAAQLRQFVNDQTRMPAKLGLSSGKFPARVAATSVNSGDLLIVPRGRESEFLAGFTVALLPVDGETLRQFDLLGWHTLGDVAAQPVSALLNRFGKQGRIIHRLANGRDTNPVRRYERPTVERVSRQLDGPVADWGPLEAVLAALVATALARDQTARCITLVVTLEDGSMVERDLTLRQPSGEARHLQRTVIEMARGLKVSCGVVEVEVTLNDMAPAIPKQLSLFDRPAVSEAHLRAALKDLVTRYGETHFYWARAADRDARLPECRYRWEQADDT